VNAKNVFVTGPPQCGKTTLIEKLVLHIENPVTGFFTREIRKRGRRTGFLIMTLDGRQGILAHEDLKGQPRVGKYGVNLQDIDQVAVPSMIPSKPGQVVVVDEVGKMECYSPAFREALTTVLNSQHPVIGSIAQKGDRLIQEIKARSDVSVVPLTAKDRNRPEQFYQLVLPFL